jgi:hypothetical protein
MQTLRCGCTFNSSRRDSFGRECALKMLFRPLPSIWQYDSVAAAPARDALYDVPLQIWDGIYASVHANSAVSPSLAVITVVSLALAIGANTAIFTVAKKVLLDTLPVKTRMNCGC